MNRRIFSGSAVNRDRRDASLARGIIAEAERRRLNAARIEPPPTPVIDALLRENGMEPANVFVMTKGEETPSLVEMDNAGAELCIWCGEPLSGNCEVRDEHYPYCSARCGLDAELEGE